VEDREKSPSVAGFEEIVGRIAGGSDSAVWELLDRYSKNILRMVRRRLPSEIRHKVDSIDIVQSVWKSLLRKGSHLNHAGTAEDFVAYLAGMAKLKVFETHRHFTQCEAFNVRREVPLNPPTALGDGGCFDVDSDRRVDRKCDAPSAVVRARENWEQAVEKAGARGQQVVQLKLQGLTLDEIAVRLKLSKSTVRRILDSVLHSLTT